MTTTNIDAAQLEQRVTDDLANWAEAERAITAYQASRRSAYTPTWFTSPIKLREGRDGDIAVKHRTMKKGEYVTITSVRQAITRGVQPTRGKLDAPLIVHELVSEKNGVWMTDLPEELNQIGEAIANFEPEGDIMVGGLGLGILAATLSAQADAARVVVVEINKSVIRLCQPRRSYYEVVNADIKYAIEREGLFDCYMLDTWQGTNESTWWSTVLPLRRAIRRTHGDTPRVWCWAEDIMQGQIMRACMRSHRHWHYAKLPSVMTVEEAAFFVEGAGTVRWEKEYGNLLPEAV